MAKVTKPLVIDAQLLENKVYDKLKKEFPTLSDEGLRKIAQHAIVEYAEKGENIVIDYFYGKESET